MLLLLTGAPPVMPLLWLLIGVVACLILIGLTFWAVNKLSASFGIPEPVRSVIIVVLVIFYVALLVYWIYSSGVPSLGR